MRDNEIMLFDLSNIAYRSLYAMKMMTTTGKPNSHIFAFTNILKGIRSRHGMSRFVFVLDSKPTRKLNMYPEYKATRESAEYNPTSDIHRFVRLINCRVVWCDGEEADDVIASFCASNIGDSINIVSSDSDLYQLIDRRNGVRQLNPATNMFIGSDDLDKKFRLSRFDRVSLWKSLFGDSGDNIKPPVARLFKKDLIHIIEACDGTVDGFMECLRNSDVPDRTMRKINMCENFVDTLKRNYSLISLVKSIDYSEKEYSGNILWLCQLLKSFECYSLIGHELRGLM